MSPCSNNRGSDRPRRDNAWEAMGILCEWVKHSRDNVTFDPGQELGNRIDRWFERHEVLDAIVELENTLTSVPGWQERQDAQKALYAKLAELRESR